MPQLKKKIVPDLKSKEKSFPNNNKARKHHIFKILDSKFFRGLKLMGFGKYTNIKINILCPPIEEFYSI